MGPLPLSRSKLQVLGKRHLDEAIAWAEQDVITNVFLISRLELLATRARQSGGEAWGWYDRGELAAVCWSGANLVPSRAPSAAIDAFARHAATVGRQCSSICGPVETVTQLWDRLRFIWAPAREERMNQPLLAISHPPRVASDSRVRVAGVEDCEFVLPASIAMFTEEVGYSPMSAEGGPSYRAQVMGFVATGRVAIITAAELSEAEASAAERYRQRNAPGYRPLKPTDVVFKAELGAVHPDAVQVQGVWIHPWLRGQGMAVPAMAAVVEWIQRNYCETVSLYVNDFNTRAIHVYSKVGFAQVGQLATVLF